MIKQEKMKLKNISSDIILLMLSTVLLVGCSSQSNSEQKEVAEIDIEKSYSKSIVDLTEAQFLNAEITFTSLEKKSLSKVLRVNGVMDVPPMNLVSISAALGGYVVRTDLLQGMYVNKGQLLATLEHMDYIQLQQDYIDNKAKLEYLEMNFKRQEELNKENVSSNKVLQQAKSDLISGKAMVNGLKEKLLLIGINPSKLNEENISSKINVYSPIGGYVSEVNVNIGKYANPNDVMFEIVDTEHLHAELTVYEKDVTKVKIGQKVRFKLPNESSEERMASVYLIGRKIDADRSVRIHAHLDSEDERLLPGMYINAIIELNDNLVEAVPSSAIINSEGGNFIFILKEKHDEIYDFEMIEVEKGISEMGFTQISSVGNIDLTNSKIVSNGGFSLISKIKNISEEGHGH